MTHRPLWSLEAMLGAMRATGVGALPAAVMGLSIDTRTIAPGEAFFAIKGDNRDGHDFVTAALEAGAGLAVVAAHKREKFPDRAPLILVADVLEGLRDLARAARARTHAKIIAVTGSVGKTGTKEALRLALSRSGETHASLASYNNHWGVPLSLARCPESARYAVFEIGMNHAGEIEPLVQLVRPQVAIITAVEPVHLEFFGSLDAIADAKAEIFFGVERGGAAVLNRDNSQFARLERSARNAGIDRIVLFGEHASADARLVKWSLQTDTSTVQARIFGTDVAYKIVVPGQHLVINFLAVLAAVALAGADLARAALALLGQANVGPLGRRVAVLGDMLELGSRGAELHRELAVATLAHGIDLVFCCGPLMRAMWEALPSSRKGGYAETSAALEPDVLAAVQPGDAVMVKGSLGSRMTPIVKALQSRYRRETPILTPAQASIVDG